MNLLNFFKNLFKQPNFNEIIPIEQIIPLPIRESFFENSYMLKLIDTYKDEYKKILTKFKYFTSLDINSRYLHEKINTNIELLINIFMTDEEIKAITLKDKIDYLINIQKIDFYLNTILELEQEVTARLVALNEIYLERKMFLSFSKKNAIINEINNLYFSFVLFYNKRMAIELEKKRYLELIDVPNLDLNEEQNGEAEKIIKQKRSILLKMVKEVFPEENIKINENIKDIAQIIRLLEIYAYEHQSEVKDLKKELEEIYLNIDSKEQNELLELVNKLEIKYRIFYDYGRDYIGIDEINELYLLKFNLQVSGDICEVFVNDSTDELELNCYKSIVAREIEALVKGKYNLNDPEGIKIIINILKHKKEIIDPQEILTDKYLLNIFLNMNDKNDLIKLLKTFKVKDFFVDSNWKFGKEIPLETVYRLMLAQNIYDDALLYTYLEKDIYPIEELYYLPEGIKIIDNYKKTISPICNYFGYLPADIFIQKMQNLGINKYVVLPSSLKEIKGVYSFFDNNSNHGFIKGLITKEGIGILQKDILNYGNLEIGESSSDKLVYYINKNFEIRKVTIEPDYHSKGHFDSDDKNIAPNYNIVRVVEECLAKNIIIEKYYDYEREKNFLKNMQNIIEVSNSKLELLSRFSVIVPTKYGRFRLQIESNRDDNFSSGTYFSLILAKRFGDCYENILEMVYNTTKKQMNWKIIRPINEEQQRQHISHVYCINTRSEANKDEIILKGIVMENGNSELEDSLSFINSKNLENYNNDFSFNANASFVFDDLQIVSINFEAYSKVIKICHRYKDQETGKYNIGSQIEIPSLSNGKFTEKDWGDIVESLKDMSIDSNIKQFIITKIRTYLNLKNNKIYFDLSYFDRIYLNRFLQINNTYNNMAFYNLIALLMENNITEFVEKLIIAISYGFNISLADLIRENSFNEENSRILKK